MGEQKERRKNGRVEKGRGEKGREGGTESLSGVLFFFAQTLNEDTLKRFFFFGPRRNRRYIPEKKWT